MTSLAKLTFKTKRAVLIGLLLAVPLLPLVGCGDDGGSGGGGDPEVENDDSRDEDDDGGLY